MPYCTECGEVVPSDGKVCAACGKQTYQPPEEVLRAQAARSNAGILIAIISEKFDHYLNAPVVACPGSYDRGGDYEFRKDVKAGKGFVARLLRQGERPSAVFPGLPAGMYTVVVCRASTDGIEPRHFEWRELVTIFPGQTTEVPLRVY